MPQKKRSIPADKYAENRAKGDAAAAKMRKEIIEKKGPAAVKGKEVDHKKPIAKGGPPTDKKNLELIPKAANRKKGAK